MVFSTPFIFMVQKKYQNDSYICQKAAVMKLFKLSTLRQKLNFVITSVSLITVVIGFLLIGFSTTKIYKRNLVNRGILNARLIGEFALIPLTYEEEGRAKQTILKLRFIPDVENCFIYDENNRLFVSYNKRKDNFRQIRANFTDTVFFAKDYLHIYQPIIFQTIKYGIVYLRISTDEIDEGIIQHIKNMFYLLLSLFFVSFFISNYFQKFISGPILELASLTRKITKQANYSVRIEQSRSDEIGWLYDSYNRMLEQIEQRQKDSEDAHKRLQENERQLQGIIDAIPHLIYLKDRKNRFLLVNEKICSLFNLTKEEIVGKKAEDLLDWIPVLDSSMDIKLVTEEHETLFVRDIALFNYWGSKLHIQLTKMPFLYEKSYVLLGVGVDITGPVKIEMELRESKELFSVFMDMLPAATFIKEANSRYLYVNEYLKRNFNAEKWLNKRIVINLTQDLKRLEDEDKRALETAFSFEEKLLDKHGNVRTYETWKFPIKRIGQKPLIGGISIEITHRKRAEERIKYYIQELKRNNEELAEFNYVASHDLREPLRTLTSYCELLKGDIACELTEDATEDIDFITNAAQRMNILILDLLDLSRAGRLDLKNEVVDLEKCIKNSLKDIEHFVNEHDVEFQIDKLPLVWGDEIHLRRVFQNLIHNAIKFNESQFPLIKIYALNPTSQMVKIVVEDNGIGIEEEFINQVFAPFKRLHSKGKYSGTGIGLAICKKIIERHGGKFEVQSKINQGSLFIFSLKLNNDVTL